MHHKTQDGWNGNLQENISTTNPYQFAVGDATHYTPATLTFSSITSSRQSDNVYQYTF